QRRPQSEGDRHRHLVHHQIDHRAAAEEALAEIEAQVAAHHHEEALVRRLVETELALELLDELRIEATRAAILRLLSACGSRCALPAASLALRPAAEAGGGFDRR